MRDVSLRFAFLNHTFWLWFYVCFLLLIPIGFSLASVCTSSFFFVFFFFPFFKFETFSKHHFCRLLAIPFSSECLLLSDCDHSFIPWSLVHLSNAIATKHVKRFLPFTKRLGWTLTVGYDRRHKMILLLLMRITTYMVSHWSSLLHLQSVPIVVVVIPLSHFSRCQCLKVFSFCTFYLRLDFPSVAIHGCVPFIIQILLVHRKYADLNNNFHIYMLRINGWLHAIAKQQEKYRAKPVSKYAHWMLAWHGMAFISSVCIFCHTVVCRMSESFMHA